LSGHRAVAPLQVFDDGRQTWLQFAPGQPVPAVFAMTPDGDILLSPKAQNEYLVLDGVWPKLRVRGGRQQSLLQRLDPMSDSLTQAPQLGAVAPPAPITQQVNPPVATNMLPVAASQVSTGQAPAETVKNAQPEPIVAPGF